MFILIYRISYATSLALTLLLFFNQKIRKGLLGRRGLLKRLSAMNLRDQHPYWFHFASSGEFEQALPIAEALKKQNPSTKILFTYFSPSGERAIYLETKRRTIAAIPLAWDYADYMPFDLPGSIRKALKLINPKALVLINRELWPELIWQCQKANTPTYLFCSFFPEHQKLKSFYHRPILRLLTKIGTVGSSTTEKLTKQFPELNVESVGDTRPQRVWERRQMQKSTPAWASFFGGKTVFLAASIWPEDFEALKPTLDYLKTHRKSRILLVPHEPSDAFVENIRAWGKERNLIFRRWSQFLQTPDDESPLIIDSVGLLAELYQISKISFVGGSFKGRIHNVLEPAAYGNAILTGPFMKNSFEATEMNGTGKGLTAHQNSDELLRRVQTLLSDPTLLRMQCQFSEEYIRERQHASLHYLKIL